MVAHAVISTPRLSAIRRQLHGEPVSPKLFVVGNGRSGTNWLARILGAHPAVRVTIENRPVFDWVTRMAVDPSSRERLLPRTLAFYRLQHLISVPKVYLDKSHPNLWIADSLSDAFPEARFLAIIRNPYATVASMLRHYGVLSWHRRWREFPLPNPFFGITAQDAAGYEELPLAAQCALRWKAHETRIRQIQKTLGHRVHVVTYEGLIRDTEPTLDTISTFIGLQRTPPPRVKHSSLNRWRDDLSPGEVDQIRAVVENDTDGVATDAAGWLAS